MSEEIGYPIILGNFTLDLFYGSGFPSVLGHQGPSALRFTVQAIEGCLLPGFFEPNRMWFSWASTLMGSNQ